MHPYHEALSEHDWLEAPLGDIKSVNPFLYYIKVLNGRRGDLIKHMRDQGVDTGIHWQAGHHFSF